MPATPAHADSPDPHTAARGQPEPLTLKPVDLPEPTALGDTALGDTALGDTALGDTSLGDTSPEPETPEQADLAEPETPEHQDLPESAAARAGGDLIEPDAPEHDLPRPTRRPRRWGPWLVLLTLMLVATLGLVVGVGIVLRGRSLGPPLTSAADARPTFVIAAVPSPSPSGSPSPAAVPSVTASDLYTVQAGDTLRSIALQVYGDAEQWPRIYATNRDTIGPDPDTLSEGMRLRIPRP